jgi:hypothetical protein
MLVFWLSTAHNHGLFSITFHYVPEVTYYLPFKYIIIQNKLCASSLNMYMSATNKILNSQSSKKKKKQKTMNMPYNSENIPLDLHITEHYNFKR